MLADAKVRASLFARAQPLMLALPPALRDSKKPTGLSVSYFRPAPRNARMATFAKRQPTKTLTLRNFDLEFSTADRSDSFGVVYRGTLRVARAGRYTFFTTSDDGSRLFIGTRCVVNNDGAHGMRESRGRIRLETGDHPITVTYYDQGGGDGLRVAWRGPGIDKQRIPDRLLATTASRRSAARRSRQLLRSQAMKNTSSSPQRN